MEGERAPMRLIARVPRQGRSASPAPRQGEVAPIPAMLSVLTSGVTPTPITSAGDENPAPEEPNTGTRTSARGGGVNLPPPPPWIPEGIPLTEVARNDERVNVSIANLLGRPM